MRSTVFAFALLASTVSAPAQDSAQDRGRYDHYRQSAAVLAHYPDVPIALDAPGLAPGRESFTSQQELEEFVAMLERSSRRITAGTLGKSQQGRGIPYLIATAEGLSDPAGVIALGRPIVWLIGLQHGNEPAGGEAMLAVAAALARGELAALTDRVSVVIVPRANPDGAAAFRRTSANGADPNRDHLLMLLPETRDLHFLMAALPPDVVLDSHEFTVGNRWIAKFGALQGVDALLLPATHPMVNKDITRLADTAFRPRIEEALKAQGLSTFDYYTTALDAADKTVSMGGNAPGAARNTFGLANAVSFLIETRGVGIGRESFQRRVATHYLAAKAVLETAAAHAAELRAATQDSRRAVAADASDIVVAHKLATWPVTLPMVDPGSGEPKPTTVTFRDSRAATPTSVRARPAGYLMMPDAGVSDGALAALRLNDITLCRVAQASDAEADAFAVRQRMANVNREAINPDQAVKVEMLRKTIRVPEGATYVPAAQPAGSLAALALEPDSPGSLTGAGLISPRAGADELPIYRLYAAPKLAPADRGDPSICQ
jgi:hypothetical protein